MHEWRDGVIRRWHWQCKALERIISALTKMCGWNCLFLYINLNEEGAYKGADIHTGVTQDAIWDHTGSDFRCLNEVRTTKNC